MSGVFLVVKCLCFSCVESVCLPPIHQCCPDAGPGGSVCELVPSGWTGIRGRRLGCLTERLWDSKTASSLSMAPLMWFPEAGRNRNLESQLFVSTSRQWVHHGNPGPLKNPANPRPDKGPGCLISLTRRQQKKGCSSPPALSLCQGSNLVSRPVAPQGSLQGGSGHMHWPGGQFQLLLACHSPPRPQSAHPQDH